MFLLINEIKDDWNKNTKDSEKQNSEFNLSEYHYNNEIAHLLVK